MIEKSSFYAEISANKRRSLALMFVFALVVLFLGYALGAYWGNPLPGFLLAFLFSGISAWVSFYYSDRIVLALTGARPISRADHPVYYDAVEGLSIAAGLPMPAVYVMDESQPNAFATGRSPEHAIICATTGLLNTLDKYELEAVIAHEMSHVRNYDVRFMTMAVVLAGMVTLLADWLLRSLFWGRRSRSSGRSQGRAAGLLILVAAVAAVLSPLLAQLLRAAVSRRREYLADASAVRLTRYPEGMIRALDKLTRNAAPMPSLNRAAAHLFTVSPLGDTGLSRFFSTHPPIADRIARLRAMDIGNPESPAPTPPAC